MKFSLFLDSYRTRLLVTKFEEPPTAHPSLILLGVRDPDQPLEFKSGGIYVNPLITPFHPFVVNGEEKLVSVFNGKPVKRMSKLLVIQTSRGWFELPPRSLRKEDIHDDLAKLITHTPKLTGVIAQVARATMSLKVPPDLDCPTESAWVDWLAAQRMALTPVIRQAFATRNLQNAHIDPAIRHLLLTGREPERSFDVRVRWYRHQTVHIIQKQLHEAQEWSMKIPESVMARGEAAILAYFDKHYKGDWRALDPQVAGIEEVSRIEEGDAIEGALIWYRPENSEQYTAFPLNRAGEAGRPVTIQDLFRETITNERT